MTWSRSPPRRTGMRGAVATCCLVETKGKGASANTTRDPVSVSNGCAPPPKRSLFPTQEKYRLMKALVTASLLLPASLIFASCSPSQDGSAPSDPSGDPSVAVAVAEEGTGVHVNVVTEAVCDFDHHIDSTGASDFDLPGTNGFTTQAR